jgi:hypothetical protein
MSKTIEIGTLVIDNKGKTYAYGGPARSEGSVSMSFDLRYGSTTVIRCDVEMVAPIDVAANVNLKDPRISVSKGTNTRQSPIGPWFHAIKLASGKTHTGWHRTKRDGVSESAHRLAIADWHEGN